MFLKKTGRYVQPADGFNVIATANTKGKGSDDGRFIGTNVLNEAFLERFALTFEQEYPTPSVETKILEKLADQLGCQDDEFCAKLATWAEVIRKTFNDGGIDEVISTRRLTHIIRAFSIFGKRMKAIEVCVNRFDDETKTSLLNSTTKSTRMLMKKTMVEFHGYIGHLAVSKTGIPLKFLAEKPQAFVKTIDGSVIECYHNDIDFIWDQ